MISKKNDLKTNSVCLKLSPGVKTTERMRSVFKNNFKGFYDFQSHCWIFPENKRPEIDGFIKKLGFVGVSLTKEFSDAYSLSDCPETAKILHESFKAHKNGSTVEKIINLSASLKNSLEEQKQKSFDDIEKEVVEELNQKHSVVHTTKTYVLTEKKTCGSGIDFHLESRKSFIEFYENQQVLLPSGKQASKAEIWLKSKDRKQYNDIVFDANLQNSNPKHYNLWKGFAVSAKKGVCEKFKAHIKNIICSGNTQYFDFVWKWLARLVQKPDLVAEVALVLIGSPGTGKNTFVDTIGSLFGVHYTAINSLDLLIGRFNSHLRNSVLIHANEALWGGNRKDIGRLKALVTDKTKVVEGKGHEPVVVQNHTHLILSSNEDWPVHMDIDDRRFFVLRVSDSRRRDLEYFKELDLELKSGGLEALLFELLKEDLTDFNHREFPQTDEALEVKLISSTSAHRYIYEAIKVGCFDISSEGSSEGWLAKKSKRSVYVDYLCWCDRQKEEVLSNQHFGRVIKKMIPSAKIVWSKKSGSNQRYYAFDSIEQTRLDFEGFFSTSSKIWIS